MKLKALLIGGALLALVARPAHASTVLQLSEDGGAFVTVASGASLATLSFTGPFGDFNISIAGTFEQNTATDSYLQSAVVNVTLASGTHTLRLLASSQDFTMPVGASNVSTSMDGNDNNTITAASFQAWADPNNGLGSQVGFTNGLQTAGISVGQFDATEVDRTWIRPATPAFSLTSLSSITLSGVGAHSNFSTREELMPVPEPTSMLMLGSGLLGLATRLRRKQPKQ